jgi:hypothetical protein
MDADMTQTISIEDIKRIHLEPGDAIIIRARLTQAEREWMADAWSDVFPHNRVVIVDPDADFNIEIYARDHSH